MQDLQKLSEDGVTIKRWVPEPATIHHTPAKIIPQPSDTGVKTRRALALEKENLNEKFKVIQQEIQPIIENE